MRHSTRAAVSMLAGLFAWPVACLAGSSAIGDLQQMTGQTIDRSAPNVPPPTAVPDEAQSSAKPAAPPLPDTRTVVAQTLFEGLANALFNPAAQQAAQRATDQAALLAQQKLAAAAAFRALQAEQEKEAAFQAQHRAMVTSFGSLGGTQNEGFKDASTTSLGFKLPGSDPEAMAAAAGSGFDTPVDGTAPPAPAPATDQATPFFGDTMPINDVRLLVEPENDPRVVDLRKAQAFVVADLKEDQPDAAPSQSARPAPASKKAHPPLVAGPILEPDPTPQQCVVLRQRMQGYLAQRERFYKTITLAAEQLDTWEAQNRSALMHAVQDGIDYFTGRWLSTLEEAGKVADAELLVLQSKRAEMVKGGLDAAELESRLRHLKEMSSTGKLADVLGGAGDSKALVQDGITTLVGRLSSAHDAVQEMLEDPRYGKYFQDTLPESRLTADIGTLVAASNVFKKWGAEKVPLIAAAQLAVNEAYNGADFYLSFERWREANQINGKVLEAAQSLQHHIDDTAAELQTCL